MGIENKTLGAAIKQVRRARGLTQAQLAASAGLSRGGKSIALMEQGRRSVSVKTLNALAKALDIPPACLAILGSRNIGTDKAATGFMRSLQKVISTVISAQRSMKAGPRQIESKSAGVRKRAHAEV